MPVSEQGDKSAQKESIEENSLEGLELKQESVIQLKGVESGVSVSYSKTSRPDSLQYLDNYRHRNTVHSPSEIENSQRMRDLGDSKNLGKIMNPDLGVKNSGRWSHLGGNMESIEEEDSPTKLKQSEGNQ